MEPKIYSDSVKLNNLTEKMCITIMKHSSNGIYNVITVIDNEQIKILSKVQINCSSGWLDVFFTLQHVDKDVINNMKYIIDKKEAPPGSFMKFSLIIQVLMKYSECRDINRLLLEIFFDKKYFG